MSLACTGCWSARGRTPSTPFPPGLARGPEYGAIGTSPTGSPTDTAGVLKEVQELGKTDPAAQQALLADLQKTDPAMWPQALQVFRSSMAYRQQHQERLAAAAPAASTELSSTPQPEPYQQVSYNSPGVQAPSESPAAYPTTGPLYSTAPTSDAVPLPEYQTGPIGPATPPPELAATYPQTNLPPIRVASTDDLTGKLTPEYVPTPTGNRAEGWRDHLASAIRLLDEEAAATGESAAIAQKRQRLLQLIAGQRDDALRPMAGLDAAQQQFWSEELLGLASLLDEQNGPMTDLRLAEAAVHLRTAAESLGKSAKLEVRNLAFCTEVTSFGVYKTFPKYEFKPGQETLLYAELENFASTLTDRGYHTSLRSSYEIYDPRGARMDEHDFAITEEFCRNPRRDFFIRYFVYMPKQIEPGTYTLVLTIEDLQSEKVSKGHIQFTIAE